MSNIQNLLNKPTSLQPHHVLKLWREKPKYFFRDALDMTLLTWQEECAELYLTNQRLAMVASKGVGKSALLSALIWHFFLTRHQPKIAVLSITKDHLMSNLWAELLLYRSRSPLLTASSNDGFSRITLKGHEGYSFIDARSFPKSADENQQASALAGLHSDNVAFFIDEGGMIPDAVFATADAALSTGDSDTKCARLVATANPEEPKGILYRAVMGRTVQKWATFRVTGDPDDPKRSPIVSVDWAREQIQTYGKDHPWVQVNVLGQYPTVASTRLITEEEIYQAQNRTVEEKSVKQSQPRLGVDVARGGIDSTALVRRRGLKVYPIELVPSTVLGPELAGKVVFIQEEHKVERVFVDNTGGYGSSVIDSLQLFPHLEVTPVVYNSKAQDDRYFNKRTEMWVRMRDWIRKGGCLPNDPALAEELLAPNLYFHGGKMRLEEKEQIKARLGKSPDRADALAQTFADPEQPSFYADFGLNGEDPEHAMLLRRFQGRFLSDESQLTAYDMQQNSNYRS